MMSQKTPDELPDAGSNNLGSNTREQEDRRRAPDQPAGAGEQYGKRSSDERNDPEVQPGASEGRHGTPYLRCSH